jgi:hypothetical protein
MAIRWRAARALGELGAAAATAAPHLLAALRAEEGYSRGRLVSALAKIANADKKVIPYLVEALRHTDPLIRAGAAEALGGVGHTLTRPAVNALIDALKDNDRRVCTAAAESLGHIGDWVNDRKLGALITALKDANKRFQAIEGEEKPQSHTDVEMGKFGFYKVVNNVINLFKRTSGVSSIPTDIEKAWDAIVAGLARDNHAWRQELAARLEDALNARIRGMKWDTLDDKKKICDVVNDTAEPLGLAVRCPNTGLPAKLKATSGSRIGVGRFYFEVYVDGQQKKTAYSDTLPDLQVMDAFPPKELDTHFQDIVGPSSSRAGRRRS